MIHTRNAIVYYWLTQLFHSTDGSSWAHHIHHRIPSPVIAADWNSPSCGPPYWFCVQCRTKCQTDRTCFCIDIVFVCKRASTCVRSTWIYLLKENQSISIEKMGKVKKEKQSADDTVGDVSIKEEDTYDDKLKNCSIIAQPMAPKKLTKKCLKLIKKGKRVDGIQSGADGC